MIKKQILSPLKRLRLPITLVVVLATFLCVSHVSAQVQNPQNGSTGLQGQIKSPPPSTGATISIPRSGQSFTTPLITVSGLCPDGLLVKLFKNNVFAGSTQCTGSSFSMQADIFDGQNELVVRVYDALDQAGPDSNAVTVSLATAGGEVVNRVSLTSNYAKRGANPGEVLTWPLILAGGTAPYAISIDWGDGSAADLKSQAFPGTFDVQHTYANPGVYNIIVKATDKNNGVAYLQLVGVGNGALSQDTGTSSSSGSNSATNTTATKTRILWEPAAIIMPFVAVTFWLGRKHELKTIRTRIERGQRPF